MRTFKPGDRVRFKGEFPASWHTIQSVEGDFVSIGLDSPIFPSSSFTRQKPKSRNRFKFVAAILPSTLATIKSTALSLGLSEGKVIDQWAEGSSK